MLKRILAHVRAGASMTKLEWMSASEVRVWVPTAPEKGKANKHVLKLLAKNLGVPPSSIHLLKGHTSSTKLFEIKNPS